MGRNTFTYSVTETKVTNHNEEKNVKRVNECSLNERRTL